MAQTAGGKHSGADKAHKIELKMGCASISYNLPDLPQNEYYPSKGDLWKLNLRSFFGFTSCIKRSDRKGIAVLAGSDDDWIIDSIVTYAVYKGNKYLLTSVNFNEFRVVTNRNYKRQRFPLRLVK